MNNIKERIGILDGFRAIAILSVIFFHFFSRWTPPLHSISLYPYGNDYNYFKYGYLGVHFFFIISGFVIVFTLDHTSNFTSFWKKRLIRLVPSMIAASLVTFLVCILLDKSNLFPKSHNINNFIPSLFFIKPELINTLFDSRLGYIDGSYWSLWPEIQFYILASIVYFLNKDKFVRNYTVVSVILILTNYSFQYFNFYGSSNILATYVTWIQNGFNLVVYLPFFSMGVLFYILYKNRQSKKRYSIAVIGSLAFLLMFIFYVEQNLYVNFLSFGMFLLFCCFIYYPGKISFLERTAFTRIGESSYFLYLIHQNIGIVIIHSFGVYFLSMGFTFPLTVMVLVVIGSIFYTEKMDRKITFWLKNKLLK